MVKGRGPRPEVLLRYHISRAIHATPRDHHACNRQLQRLRLQLRPSHAIGPDQRRRARCAAWSFVPPLPMDRRRRYDRAERSASLSRCRDGPPLLIMLNRNPCPQSVRGSLVVFLIPLFSFIVLTRLQTSHLLLYLPSSYAPYPYRQDNANGGAYVVIDFLPTFRLRIKDHIDHYFFPRSFLFVYLLLGSFLNFSCPLSSHVRNQSFQEQLHARTMSSWLPVQVSSISQTWLHLRTHFGTSALYLAMGSC